MADEQLRKPWRTRSAATASLALVSAFLLINLTNAARGASGVPAEQAPIAASQPHDAIPTLALGNTPVRSCYRRSCQEQGLARAFCANSALYAKPANALPSKVFSEVVDLASGDVVQLVRTLPAILFPL